jgi:hypothetical protein
MQVAFYKGRSRLFNRLVSWWLRGPYSHCELVIRVDSQGRAHCLSSSFLDGGTRIKLMVLDPDHWDVLPVHAAVPAGRAYSWAHRHAEAGYDLLGLLGFVWRRQQGDKARWFCSEAVADVLGIPEPWRFDPCALHAVLASQQQHRPADAGLFHGETN